MIRSKISVGIIGFGNLGKSLTQGFLRRNAIVSPQYQIFASTKETIKPVSSIKLIKTNQDLVRSVNYLILCVKPTQIEEVCDEIHSVINPKIPIISMAAAVPLNKLIEWLPKSETIIRCMTNLPCEIGQGSFYYHSNMSELKTKQILCKLFDKNQIFPLESDEKLDLATLISGCGPAFLVWYINQLYLQGKDGLTDEELNLMIIRMIKGTADLLKVYSIEEIIKLVASPGGITETMLNCFDEHEIDLRIYQALMLAKNRIQTLKQI